MKSGQKRIYDMGGYLRGLRDNIATLPGLAKVFAGSMDSRFREKIMLSISRMNDCRHCTAIHGTLADRAGLSDEEKLALQNLDPGDFEHREWVGLEYARRVACAEDCDYDPELEKELRELYTEEEIAQIRAVANGINFANRCGNTWDSFLGRLRGEADEDSSLLDELVILATLLPAGPFFLLVSGILQRRGDNVFSRESAE